MRFRFHQQLAVQLVFATLLPILLVSGLISVSMIQVRREQLLEQARLRALQAGQTGIAIYTDHLAFARLLAGLLSDRPVLTQHLISGNIEGLQEFVRQTRTDTLFDLVTIINASGTMLAQEGATALWRPDHPVTDDLAFWGMPNLGLVVQVSAPMSQGAGYPGRFVGSFVLDADFLAGLRDQTNVDKSILFGDQLVATSLAGRAAAGSGFLERDAVDQVLEQGAPVVIEATIADVPYLVHYTPVHRPDGSVIGAVEVLLPLAPVHAAQRQATTTLLVITIVAALAATLLGWLLAQQFSGSIRQLAQSAETIGADLTRPITVSGPHEIQILSQSIERMRQHLYKTHSALQAEKARYANILESVEEGVITLDQAERVTSLNQSAEAMLAITRGKALGLPFGQVVPINQDTMLTLARIPPIGALQLAIRAHDGRELTIAATRSQVHTPADGTLGEHIVVLRDISEEAAVERLKEEFLANITHEFRTPLSALIASLEILREEAESLTADERLQMLTAIHLGVQQLDTLVQNLLDSASLQAGYFRVEPDATRLKPLIEEAVEIMRPLVQQRGQTIDLLLPEELPSVLADDRRIVQVLVNLLSNSSKFGPRGDKLEIVVQVESAHVRVAITDHGPGIAASRQVRLFERFVRPGTETIRAQGIGLGLAIVKAIVERHGSQVIIQSGDGVGTTFEFVLPRAPDQRMAPFQGMQPDVDILIVPASEDEIQHENPAGR